VRRRLDSELVRRGLAGSRTEARETVEAGLVSVSGRPATKPSTLVDPADPVTVGGPVRRFVSRGGEKLEAALERFAVEVRGRDCLDAGASTGGFTDCLLRRGAARVAAVDVGYGQLAWSLRQDPRVIVLERTNVRDLRPERIPFAPSLVAADLSFISLRLVLPALVGVAAPDAELVVLVKPQFEVGADAVGRGGVVREPAAWRSALDGVVGELGRLGFEVADAMASPLLGPAGNVEFLLHARTSGAAGPAAAPDRLAEAVGEGVALREAGARREGAS